MGARAKVLKDTLAAIMSGELLLRMRFDRFFIHILYFFVVAWAAIFVSLKIEQTLVKVERNKATLETLRINHAQKTYELAKYDRLSTVEQMLRDAGSDVTVPQKPAARIKKK